MAKTFPKRDAKYTDTNQLNHTQTSLYLLLNGLLKISLSSPKTEKSKNVGQVWIQQIYMGSLVQEYFIFREYIVR